MLCVSPFLGVLLYNDALTRGHVAVWYTAVLQMHSRAPAFVSSLAVFV